MTATLCVPDLSTRPHGLRVTRDMAASPAELYAAWTTGFERWFAAPGSALMTAEVNAPFFFEVHFEGQRHPHYGRFLRLEPDHLVELTWVTGAGGSEGAETVVTVELAPKSDVGTQLTLSHTGFPNASMRDRTEDAWPLVLAQLNEKLRAN